MAEIRIGSVRRAFDIVERLVELENPSAAEIADELSMPPSTAIDYLSTLEELGIVVKERHRYRLSSALLRIGESVRRREVLYRAARPVVDDLARTTGEIAVVGIEEFGQSVTYCVSMNDPSVDLGLFPGLQSPIHAVATGKVLLAFMSEERRDSILDRIRLEPITPNTVTDEDELRTELDAIRENNRGYNREEYSKGIQGVAAPIFFDNEVRAAIAVVGPTGWMESDRFSEDAVMEGANRVEINLSPPVSR